MHHNQKTNLGIFLLICGAASFGLYPSLAKLAYAENVSQSYLIVVTTLFRALTLYLFASIVQKHSLKSVLDLSWESVISGFLQAVSIFGIIASLKYIPGPVMITIVFTHTIMLLLYSAYKGRIKLTKAALITTTTALAGVALVVDLYSNLESSKLLGVNLAFIAAFATACRMYAFGELAKTIPSVKVGARAMSYAIPFLCMLFIFQKPEFPASITAHFYVTTCGLSLALGSLLTFYVLSLIDIFRISFILKIEPVFTSIYGILLLGEFLKPLQYLGILLVLGSLVTYEYFARIENT